MCACVCLQRPEEGVQFPGAGVTVGCDLRGYWKPACGVLEK